MRFPVRALAALAALGLSGCPVPDWFEPTDPGAPRPVARAGGSQDRPSASPEAGADAPAAPEGGPRSPGGEGWDAAPPAAPDPFTDPRAAPPPTPGAPPVPPPMDPANPPPLAPGAQAAGTSDADPLYYPFTGKEPPDLAADGRWLTAAPAPTLAGLRGQVVYLQFAFQTCPSCALMTPYLQQ